MEKGTEQDTTPLMKQYWALKAEVGDALLLFRMGDFYELFGSDATIAAQILQITLTTRDKHKPNPLAMAGVPHHSIQSYLPKLLAAGKKVALSEQVSEPTGSSGKTGLVARKITRILSPAIQFDLEPTADSKLLANLTPVTAQGELVQVAADGRDELKGATQRPHFILACLDASTGEIRVSGVLSAESLLLALAPLPIGHWIYPAAWLEGFQNWLPSLFGETSADATAAALHEPLGHAPFSEAQAKILLKNQYQIEQIGEFFQPKSSMITVAELIYYLLRSQRQERLAYLQKPLPLLKPQSLRLGPKTPEHLDLVSVLGLMRKTRSAVGGRTLKRWLWEPLTSPAAVLTRQKAVQGLMQLKKSSQADFQQAFGALFDLERLSARIQTGLATPRDTLALGVSLQSLQAIHQLLADFLPSLPLVTPPSTSPTLLVALAGQLQSASQRLSPLAQRILRTQVPEAPLTARDGGIFLKNTTPELDQLLTLTQEGQLFLQALETRERQATGIASLKVRLNRVFGYYIEITSAQAKNVPAHYQRKQTMVGAERFFTPELKQFEENILTASERQKTLEYQLFCELVREAAGFSQELIAAAQALGELESLLSFAEVALQPRWSFPEILEHSLDLTIRGGRHPLVDQALGSHFVANDLVLSPQGGSTLLITGPNMGGKSTVMRQVALIVLLGQCGAPIPAVQASWGWFSSIFTRIGANDAITQGQSTFMVEMSELAHILHHADQRSLILLDEIGRGTSTFDGISVAWAALEWMSQKLTARTLFATHYHELTALAESLPGLRNAHMGVDVSHPDGHPQTASSTNPQQQRSPQKKLRFLYQLLPGPAQESFGIHVAQMAGLPQPLIQRAWSVLQRLEGPKKGDQTATASASTAPPTLSPADAASPPEPTPPDEPTLEPAAESQGQGPKSGKKSAMPEQLSFPEVRWVMHPLVTQVSQLNLNEITPLQAIQLLAEWQKQA